MDFNSWLDDLTKHLQAKQKPAADPLVDQAKRKENIEANPDLQYKIYSPIDAGQPSCEYCQGTQKLWNSGLNKVVSCFCTLT